MGIGDKIRLLREKRGLTLEQVGNYVGVGKSTVRKWETGQIANMRRDKIEKLAAVLGVSPLDIIGVENSSYDYARVPPAGFSSMPEMDNLTPLIGDIACGSPILAEENIREYLATPRDWHADFSLQCCGDSMSPGILDGDIVAIRKVPHLENGQIAAVRIDNEATLKRVYLFSDKLVLQAENPSYEPIILIGEDMSRAVIEGLAVGLMRNL